MRIPMYLIVQSVLVIRNEINLANEFGSSMHTGVYNVVVLSH